MDFSFWREILPRRHNFSSFHLPNPLASSSNGSDKQLLVFMLSEEVKVIWIVGELLVILFLALVGAVHPSRGPRKGL